jgi:hypothetical protein
MGLEGWLVIGGVVLILGLVALFMFRPQLADLLNRIRAIGPRGLRIDPIQQQTAQVEKDPGDEAEKLLRQFEGQLFQEVQEHVTKDFQARGLSGDAGLKMAIRYIAVFKIAQDFEYIYRLIFGSQLRLLSYLNTERQHHPRETLRTFYTVASTDYSQIYEHRTYEEWLAFLFQSALIREDNGQLAITVKGCEFIAHLAKLGYTLDKFG